LGGGGGGWGVGSEVRVLSKQRRKRKLTKSRLNAVEKVNSSTWEISKDGRARLYSSKACASAER